MRSLTLKLTLAFLVVGIATVALVGAFAVLRTRDAFDRWEFDRNVLALAGKLEDYYSANGSWSDAEHVAAISEAEAGRSDWWQMTPMALLDANRTVVFASEEMERLGRMPLRQPVRGIALRANGDTVGWLIVGRTPMPPPDRLLRPEQILMQRIVRAIAFGALGAVCLALVLGIILARTITRPIRELTSAAEAIGDGQLGAQVPIHSQDELGQLARSFNQMSADLARTTDARRQMTADVAHELRTPLSVILGYSEALQDGKLEGDAQTYAAMYDTARQLQRLVDDLRTLALADAGELMLNRRPVEPRALLERCLLAQMAQAQGAQVQLRIKAAEDLPDVDADPDRIAQVLNNLAVNAVRHTPAGGSVTLSAAPALNGDGVVLEVADTGSGIAPEDLPYVFDRFYRGDKARQSDNGESGLGLSIARSIVESHGGTIEVASERGSGTTFTITLPSA